MVTTGNKSEMSVGYATLYGDMNGGFNPIKDLYKTEVFRLARLRNRWKPDGALGPGGTVIPENVITRAPSAELREQLEVLAKDSEISAVKIGMLGNRGNAVVVGEFLDAHKFPVVVHDPVMKSSSNSELLDGPGVKYLTTELLKRCTVITPNVPEAEILTGITINSVSDMEAAARKIGEMGATAVIVKGGHMDRAIDVVFDGKEVHQLSGDKVKLENTHGTGCTFASAITAQLAAGRGLVEAATLAKAYVVKAIEKAYPVGKGRVPLDHFYRMNIEPPARGTHALPDHGVHPAAEPAAH